MILSNADEQFSGGPKNMSWSSSDAARDDPSSPSLSPLTEFQRRKDHIPVEGRGEKQLPLVDEIVKKSFKLWQ